MNYRHSYHAGNFADAFKHIILVALTKSFMQKDSAFCYLDTHAGIGSYDLKSNEARKSGEAETGIEKIWEAKNPPALIKDYLDCVRQLNPDGNLKFYPGSPAIVRQLLRKQDRMVLTELHAEDYKILKRTFPHDKQVGVHLQDAYHALKAFLPPQERRGFVLIDPPYEKPDELSDISTALAKALERWDSGIFVLWYPIKESRALERFHRMLAQKISQPKLICELSIYPENLATHLNGSGVLIVNPPWKLDQELNGILPWLWKTLSPDALGRYGIRNL
jgi:23S rRNA (adenine2030-N6)-methyltransferase